jgi:hypothetical protein
MVVRRMQREKGQRAVVGEEAKVDLQSKGSASSCPLNSVLALDMVCSRCVVLLRSRKEGKGVSLGGEKVVSGRKAVSR